MRGPINVTSVTTPPHIHPIRGITRKESTRRSASSEGGRQLMGSINRAAGSAQTQLIELWHATFLAALLSSPWSDLFSIASSYFYHLVQNIELKWGVLVDLKHFALLILWIPLSSHFCMYVQFNENFWPPTNKYGHKNTWAPKSKDTWSYEQTENDVTNTARQERAHSSHRN